MTFYQVKQSLFKTCFISFIIFAQCALLQAKMKVNAVLDKLE